MKVRFRFTKLGKVRWTSHRDVARMWERALRRVELPVAYSEGFSPRPKVSFGLALPTGAESWAEYLDADLDGAFDVESLPALISPALPQGIDVTASAVLPVPADSLQHEVTSCTWSLEVLGASTPDLSERIANILAAPTLVVRRERKGRVSQDDIRPAITSLTVAAAQDDSGPVSIECELATQTRGLRPSELMAVLGTGLEARRVIRIAQWIKCDGACREPLPAVTTDAPPALERV